MSDESLRRIVERSIEEMRARQASAEGVRLGDPSWDAEEILEAIDSLLSGDLTMGRKVAQFEELFSDYIGAPGAVMVNSGSSANFLAMMLISNPEFPGHLRPGDEVITPAVTWSTTVFSILAAGLTPVLVDVDPESLVVNTAEVEKAITPRTRAIFCVHLLGNPCEGSALASLAERHDLLLIEDCCEALGATERRVKVGSFGDVSTFSFFFSHHITTVEGGVVLAKEEGALNILRSMRAHGWIRERSDRDRLAGVYSQFDPRFLFVNLGFNFRPTEIQGAFGLHQLDKLEDLIRIRRENARYLTEKLEPYSTYLQLPRERPGTRHTYFGYPVVTKQNSSFTAPAMQQFLERRGIETRPIMSGNIARHPGMKLFGSRYGSALTNADLVARHGFFFGVHPGLHKKGLTRIVDSVTDFMTSKGVTAKTPLL